MVQVSGTSGGTGDRKCVDVFLAQLTAIRNSARYPFMAPSFVTRV